MINPTATGDLLESLATFLRHSDDRRITIVSPLSLPHSAIESCVENPRFRVRYLRSEQSDAISFDSKRTSGKDRICDVASCLLNRTQLFLGGAEMLSVWQIFWPALFGSWCWVCLIEGMFTRCSMPQLLLRKIALGMAYRLRRAPSKHLVKRITGLLRTSNIMRRVWRKIFWNNQPSEQTIYESVDGKAFEQVLYLAEHYRPPLTDFVPNRVIHVNAGLAGGGTERQICETLQGIQSRGLSDVLLLGEHADAIESFEPYLDDLKGWNIAYEAVRPISVTATLHQLPGDLAIAVSQLPKHEVPEILALWREFRERKPFVVHAWQDASSVRAGIAAAMAGVPRIILSGRNIAPVSLPTFLPHLHSAYRALVNAPGVILSNNSHAGAISYAEWLEIRPEEITVIHNALKGREPGERDGAGFRKSLGIPASVPVVGGVFRLVPQKRPLLWVNSIAYVARKLPESQFILIGDGPVRQDLVTRIRVLGLEGRVHLLGSQSDLGDFYSAIDILLHVSMAEGLANVLLEAQDAGVPVICTNAGGNREAVNDGTTGLICDEPDAEILGAAVLHAVRDADWISNARRVGPGWVGQKFSLQKMVKETMHLYALAGKS